MESTPYKLAVIAHRGASAHAPENTLAAFHLALDQRADGVELDVHLSSDGHLIVIHDDDLSRTTTGTGKVGELTLAEIRAADAGNGEKVPTLDEVLSLIQDKLWINIEFKGFAPYSPQLPEKVLALVKAHGLGEKIIYSSFDPRLLIQTRKLQPDAKVGMLLLPGLGGKLVRWVFETFVRPWSLHPHHTLAQAKFMQRAHHRGQKVLCWTVNQPEEMLRLKQLGVWGVITDNPSLALKTREEAR